MPLGPRSHRPKSGLHHSRPTAGAPVGPIPTPTPGMPLALLRGPKMSCHLSPRPAPPPPPAPPRLEGGLTRSSMPTPPPPACATIRPMSSLLAPLSSIPWIHLVIQLPAGPVRSPAPGKSALPMMLVRVPTPFCVGTPLPKPVVGLLGFQPSLFSSSRG